MTMMSAIGMRRCDARIDALRAEFGAMLAERIVEAEAADFLWEARVREAYLGAHVDIDLNGEVPVEDVSRMAFLSHLDGGWHAGICLVGGEGAAIDLVWAREFESFGEAEIAFFRSR